MKTGRLLSILAVVAFQQALSQQSFYRIPKTIVDTLNCQYPGWHLANNMNVLKNPEVSYTNLDTAISLPNLVWGDFDNDKRLDYAIYIQRTNNSGKLEEMLIAFLARDSTFQEFVLRDAIEPVYFANYIWLAKKGSEESFVSDSETANNTFVLENDGIDLITIGKGSEVILYKNGHFVTVVTSD